jgi:hypothetical protein
MTNKLINQTEACELVGISRSGFRKWGLRPVKRDGRYVLYDREAVLRISRDKQSTSLQHRGRQTTEYTDQDVINFMALDLVCECARDSAYIVTNACREFGIDKKHIDEIVGALLLVPAAIAERHNVAPGLDNEYLLSGKALLGAVRSGGDLPKEFPTRSADNPFEIFL